MSVVVIGGMDRLKSHYVREAEKFGISLKVHTKHTVGLTAKIRHTNAVVIFTNKVSHRAKKEVMNVMKGRGIPVYMYHSCGVCTLRNCFNCLMNERGGK